MSRNRRGSFTDRSRPWRVLLVGLGGLWAAVTLPLTATAFGFAQRVWVFDSSVYVEARLWAGNPPDIDDCAASMRGEDVVSGLESGIGHTSEGTSVRP
jgi:hypothetical protein